MSPTLSTKIKPLACPFCGEVPSAAGALDSWFIRCESPFCQVAPRTLTCLSVAGAVSIWNTRAADPRLAELESTMKGFCDELGCTDLTPSGNVVMAMVRLKELQRRLAELRAIAEALAHAIKTGNNHGYGLRICDDATTAFVAWKGRNPE